jgi:hypothetical protein
MQLKIRCSATSVNRPWAAGGTVDTGSGAVTLKLKASLDGMVKQAKDLWSLFLP